MLKRTSTQRHAQKTRNLTIPYSAIKKKKTISVFTAKERRCCYCIMRNSSNNEDNAKGIVYRTIIFFFILPSTFVIIYMSVEYTDLCAVVVC